MSGVNQYPRAVIHRRILDVAAGRKQASIETIAAQVSGATPELVERVLDEYGDPAHTTSTTAETPTMPEEPTLPDPDDLTTTQRETLRAISDHPDATQQELADILGVSNAAICQRVNAIQGFEWHDRRAFVEAVVPPAAAQTDGGSLSPQNAHPELDEVLDRLDSLEQRLGSIEDRGTDVDIAAALAVDDPVLVHKVLHACMHSDHVTEEEELALVRAFL